jgi:ADP-heptose:LPS heptosyltransferase
VEAIPGVRKIAVLRANGIGDHIFALPALRALRDTYPQAEIALLGKPWHATFWRNRPGPIDRVIVVPPVPGVGEAEDYKPEVPAIAAFQQAMAAAAFDLGLQLHGGGRFSNPFLLALRPGLTAGLRAAGAAPLDRWLPYVYFQHEVLRFLEVVELVGARSCLLEPELALTPRDRDEAGPFLPPRPFVVIHPGATDPRRRWPVEKLAVAGSQLARMGLDVVVSGDSADAGRARAVVEAMDAPAHSLAGQLSLGGLAALLASARLAISNDSGPLHLARAVGTPTAGIYWCGNYINAGPLHVGKHRAALSWRLECPSCGVNCISGDCPHQDSFVADVDVEQVVSLAGELLNVC